MKTVYISFDSFFLPFGANILKPSRQGGPKSNDSIFNTPSQPLADPLTNRELDALDLLAQRLCNKEIVDKLFISTTTVKGYLQNIYGKLNVSGRRQAVDKAMELGILKRR